MKKLNLFSITLVTLMFGACSNELNVKGTDSGGVLPGEKGYISMAVNLPTQPSTRANDNFYDGESYEYNVNDATLLIFSGNEESSATFSGAYDLKANFMDQSNDGQISTTAKIIQEIEKPAGNNVYALVVLNKAGFLSYENDKWYYGTDSEKAELTASTTFSAFAYTAKTFDVGTVANPTGNFLMFNAPLYDKPGGDSDPTVSSDGKVTTLAVIDKSKIYPTEIQAQNNPATSIYVERAVAKVTVSQGANFSNNSENTKFTPTLKGWILDITNKKSFPVRNMGTAGWWGYMNAEATVDAYRFVGDNQVYSHGGTNYYRTYFGIDPNYNGTDGASYVNEQGNVIESYEGFNINYDKAPTQLNAIGTNAYCLENTFNVDNMRKDQTTRVIVAAQLTLDGDQAGDDFFVLNDDKTTFYAEADVINLIKNAYIKSSFVQAIIHDSDNGLDVGSTFDENDIVVKFKKGNSEPKENIGDLDGGTILVAEVYTAASAAEDFKNDVLPEGLKTNNTSVTEDINDMYAISFYKGGIAYYPVMIKHFGDDQTPWNGITQGYTESYPDPNRENNWLGRYGVLRNNWYEIEVTAVKNIGSAEVEPETGFDDPVESWISVEINVLSWAKRKQSVDL